MTDWVVDLDGVMWRGEDPIEGSAEAVAELLARGERVLFCTNNSTYPGEVRASQLADQGIPGNAEVVTSADAVCGLVRAGERVLVVGSTGLVEALRAQGNEVASSRDLVGGSPDDPTVSPAAHGFDAVVVGLARDFDYPQLDLASAAVRSGARLLATNSDVTFPAAGRLQPGTGSVVAAVEAASGSVAEVAGKPNAAMAQLIERRLGPGASEAVVVGDVPATDGRLAQQLGRPFALVLSGVTKQYRPLEDLPVAMVAADLASLVAGNLIDVQSGTGAV